MALFGISMDPVWFKWVLLPLLIFVARICDVSLGTLRIIFVSRGLRYLAPCIGFFEVLLWLIAIGQIMQNLNDFHCYLAYAAGFAFGTFIGMTIEDRLAMGVALIRVITCDSTGEVVRLLRDLRCGVTSLDARGAFQPVKVVLSIVKRREIRRVLEQVKLADPEAIYTIEDVRSVSPHAFKTLTNPLAFCEDSAAAGRRARVKKMLKKTLDTR